jgi:hypothetical protein
MVRECLPRQVMPWDSRQTFQSTAFRPVRLPPVILAMQSVAEPGEHQIAGVVPTWLWT